MADAASKEGLGAMHKLTLLGEVAQHFRNLQCEVYFRMTKHPQYGVWNAKLSIEPSSQNPLETVLVACDGWNSGMIGYRLGTPTVDDDGTVCVTTRFSLFPLIGVLEEYSCTALSRCISDDILSELWKAFPSMLEVIADIRSEIARDKASFHNVRLGEKGIT